MVSFYMLSFSTPKLGVLSYITEGYADEAISTKVIKLWMWQRN